MLAHPKIPVPYHYCGVISVAADLLLSSPSNLKTGRALCLNGSNDVI